MPLFTGDQLGPYEIQSAIGAGGMGEVFKARDTRLDRTVAIKVLPEHIAQREDLRARFEREARAVASLNHPNICTLHDIGRHGDTSYMVMELIEGESLADRIAKGPIPLDQSLKLATQIADALDRAHRAGVTHRDVKPQNIMLTRDGAKVLDFGLAKSQAKSGPTEETLTNALTSEGTVMGTPQYMAPEQFAGKEADARSDIWAFGAVLYEMVTGRKAFQGANYQSLVGAILATDPAPMAVEPFTPSWLERLVRRCLAKDPEDRWQSIRDIVIELRSPPAAEGVNSRPKTPRWLWAGGAAALLLIGVLTGWGVTRVRRAPSPDQAYRAQLEPPEGGQFEFNAGFALSPDGRTLAFIASAPGKRGLWILPVDGTAARLLPGTESASQPFWSPDSRSLAYRGNHGISRVHVAGGLPEDICQVRAFVGGTWSGEGDIVFAEAPAGLRRVPAAGGTPTVLTTVDTGRGEDTHTGPQVLPGGRILFRITGKAGVGGLYVTSLANPHERVRLVPADSHGVYAAGHLLWLRGSTLVAQRFDPEQMKLSGEPEPIAAPVGRDLFTAAASSSGLLVHGRGAGTQLRLLDRAGSAAPSSMRTPGQPDDYATFAISPDGRRVAADRRSGSGRTLWIGDMETDAWRRFTFLPGTSWTPVWSPDGKQILFRSGSPSTLYRKDASGIGTEQRVIEAIHRQWPTDWSRDGRLVLYDSVAPDTKADIWVLPVQPDGMPSGKARPYLRSGFSESEGRFSPEIRPEPGPRWVAYTSNESGRDEVYVQAFPEPRGKFQISTGGGRTPMWSPDGRELFYVSSEGKLMAAALILGTDSVTPATPRELFALPGGQTRSYAVAPDGKHFLVVTPAGGSQPLEVVVNWQALLKNGVSGE